MSEPLLKIENLHAVVAEDGTEILRGVDLEIGAGEIHAIMGPNGSGKSTLSKVLSGHPAYEVTDGSVTFKGEDLLELEVDERARAGSSWRSSTRWTSRASRSRTSCARRCRRTIRTRSRHFRFPGGPAGADGAAGDGPHVRGAQSVNDGFSGGEKKRNEILQLAMLKPALAVLDETDSGLDIDALKVVSAGVNKLHAERPEMSFLLITHYQRILNYIRPDHVHVMVAGRIARSGGFELAEELEAGGLRGVPEPARPASVTVNGESRERRTEFFTTEHSEHPERMTTDFF
jgi:Fe-S cluster assembly ATP-binding protein